MNEGFSSFTSLPVLSIDLASKIHSCRNIVVSHCRFFFFFHSQLLDWEHLVQVNKNWSPKNSDSLSDYQAIEPAGMINLNQLLGKWHCSQLACDLSCSTHGKKLKGLETGGHPPLPPFYAWESLLPEIAWFPWNFIFTLSAYVKRHCHPLGNLTESQRLAGSRLSDWSPRYALDLHFPNDSYCFPGIY